MANTLFRAFTIGKDMSLAIELKNVLGGATATSPNTMLDISDIGMLENFQANPTHNTIEAKPISHGGQSVFRDTFGNWEGSFDVIRTGPMTDLLLQVLQDALLSATGGSVTVNIYQTVYDPLGLPSGNQHFAFMDAVLTPSGGGNYAADNPVNNSFSFRAPRRDIIQQDTANVPTGEARTATSLLDALRQSIN